MTTNLNGIYTGDVIHKRLRPHPHALKYGVFSLLLDCTALDKVAATCRCISHNRFNLISIYDRDHGNGTPLPAYLNNIAATATPGTAIKKFMMLCYPRILGYAFNPLTVYYGLDDSAQIKLMIYEVNNTFGERKTYVIPIDQPDGQTLAHGCDKELYVSPFNTNTGTYSFRISPISDTMTVGVALRNDGVPLLKAHFHAKRTDINDANLLRAVFKTGWLPLKVILGIHFEAAKLFIKGMRMTRKPAPPAHPITYITARNESS